LGFYHSLLLVLGLSLLLPGTAVPSRRSACLACHGSHYAELGSCVSCHRGNDHTDRKGIAHQDIIDGRFAHFTIKGRPVVEQGKKLILALACRRCHIYERQGNPLATNLDRLAANTAPQALFEALKSPVLFMPDFHLDEAQLNALVNAILAAAERDGKAGETPQVVHFEDEKRSRENIFVRHCGPCHKVLSERFGGLGSGSVGPNLSGLFSPFYPRTYRDAESWSPEKLKKWLENPRNIKANARMTPVRLTEGDFAALLEIMGNGQIK